MKLDGLIADREAVSDALVGESLGQQLEHIDFTRRQCLRDDGVIVRPVASQTGLRIDRRDNVGVRIEIGISRRAKRRTVSSP